MAEGLIRIQIPLLPGYVKEHGLPLAFKQSGAYVWLAYDEKYIDDSWKKPDLEPAIQKVGGGYYRIPGRKKAIRGRKAAENALRKAFSAKT